MKCVTTIAESMKAQGFQDFGMYGLDLTGDQQGYYTATFIASGMVGAYTST